MMNILSYCIEPCDENNGGCEANAVCSTEDKSVVVKCTCKEGYVTRGSGSGTEVKCISKMSVSDITAHSLDNVRYL